MWIIKVEVGDGTQKRRADMCVVLLDGLGLYSDFKGQPFSSDAIANLWEAL